MPFKIDIQTNMDDVELTIESCNEIIDMLKDASLNIKNDMYNYFLGKRSLIRAIVLALLSLLLYTLTDNFFFVYFIPISVILSFVLSIVYAEYITQKTKKVIQDQINHFSKEKERLLRREQLNS